MMDLQTLSRKQAAGSTSPTDRPGQHVPAPRRRWLTRYMLPLAVVLATAALLAYASRDLLLPATPVQVVRAVALPGTSSAANTDSGGDGLSATPRGPARVVAQAPGWVEPDPYPTYAAALADGVVERVLVLEGEAVTAGQPLVELVREDAELALARRVAELERRRAALTAAAADLAEPVALRRAAAVAAAGLAEAEAGLTRHAAQVAQAEAKLAELEATYDRLAALDENAASRVQVEAAMYQAQSQRAAVEAVKQQRPVLEALVDRARAELTAAQRELELMTDLHRMHDEAQAAVEEAGVAVAEAELRLGRMTVTSPIDGVVMDRLVAPGDKVMQGGDMAHSAHVVHLYEPAQLQVRVDVPLSDAAAVGVGQDAVIVVDVLPDVEFRGVVTRRVHQADIAKNTVQFKVSITDPAALLSPDMLARVKFLGRGGGAAGAGGDTVGGGAATGSGSATPVAIKKSAVVAGGGEGDMFVWLVTPDASELVRRSVMLGSDHGDGMVEVLAGLNPGDAVVDTPNGDLREGQRVRIRDAL